MARASKRAAEPEVKVEVKETAPVVVTSKFNCDNCEDSGKSCYMCNTKS